MAAAAVLSAAVLAAPVMALAGQQQLSDREASVFVAQAPPLHVQQVPADTPAPTPANPPADDTSKVYFPDEITPEAIAEARARLASQEQLNPGSSEERDRPFAQVSAGESPDRPVEQLSDGDSVRALAQLTEAERQVLLEAVEGTDICERTTNIPSIQVLCDGRIETRSAQFTRAPQRLPGEDLFNDSALDVDRASTLESAIARLAQNTGDSGDFSNQVIASVALDGGRGLSDVQAGSAQAGSSQEGAMDGLSAETQALVNAIVAQFGGQTGGR